MSQILVEPHYLGSIAYYALLLRFDRVQLEVHDTFKKQTYRNRCYFLLSNKVQPLVIPLKYRNGDFTKEVKIDYSQRWVKDHWGAFYSAYGKAPFFAYFEPDFRKLWETRYTYLVDMLVGCLELSFRLIQIDIGMEFTDQYRVDRPNDYRNKIHPKSRAFTKKCFGFQPYAQLFGHTFTKDMSIVDLLLNEGTNTCPILTQTTVNLPKTNLYRLYL